MTGVSYETFASWKKDPSKSAAFKSGRQAAKAVNFGVPISNDQKVAIDSLLGAVLAIVAGVVIRSQVTPVSKVPVPVPPASVPPAP